MVEGWEENFGAYSHYSLKKCYFEGEENKKVVRHDIFGLQVSLSPFYDLNSQSSELGFETMI